ncbi:MAG TPA: hypothetical protein PLX33_09385 [Alphaproteobacteria bacterium]|nr:hypothetical protein [Alphaproteobacteria bacterium]
MIKKIKNALDAAFERISREFNDEGVTVVMPTYTPPQGRLLSEFNRVGGNAVIAGGKKDAPAFKNVPQHGLDFDTTPYINSFPKGMSEQIVGAFPDAVLQDKKVAVFAFITPPASWARYIEERNLNTNVIASNEQNTRLFFENKGNLMHILKEAGLGAYVIPTEVVEAKKSEAELRAIYNRVKSDSGKVVVQPCVENYEPTRFIDSEDAFVAHALRSKTPFKVTRFVEGNEANLSFFVGNTLPNENGRGVTKCNLPEGIDRGKPESLALIEAHAASKGIDASNVFSVTGRATLKVVGDSLLANEPGDSVGNNIGHVYEEKIAKQIAEIGDKLGCKMALGGKVGLAGADLIIDRSGKIWINEINDRQQGPTDQMSADAESNGIPGLSRMAWFAHFADFSKSENTAVLAALRDNAAGIHQQYATSSGSFYIKVYATHDSELDGSIKALQDLPAGTYSVRKENGKWEWKALGENAKLSPIDLASGAMTVKINGGSLKAGDQPAAGAELFRITGIASGDNAPFVIENGVSCINPAWRGPLKQLYADCFGADYVEKNPLYRATMQNVNDNAVVRPPKNLSSGAAPR